MVGLHKHLFVVHKPAAQSVNDPLFLVGQTITQPNNPADATINAATAIVENITKFQEGSIVVIEIAVNDETVTGTFVTGDRSNRN